MHERISVNSICFPGSSLSQQAGYWREIGIRQVGLMAHVLNEEGGLAAAQQALASGNYQVATVMNSFMSGGHIQADERTWQEPRAKLNRAIELAKTVGAQTLYMTTGGHGSLTWEEAAESFSAAVAPCVAQAKTAGVHLLIECSVQLNAHIHLAHTLRDTAILAEMAGVGINIDIFSAWQESGLRETIKRVMPRCHLVQVSDYIYGDRFTPSRAVPGDGDIPLRRIIDWILSAGYTGAFDLELLGPRIDKEGHFAATRRAAERTSEILQSLGA